MKVPTNTPFGIVYHRGSRGGKGDRMPLGSGRMVRDSMPRSSAAHRSIALPRDVGKIPLAGPLPKTRMAHGKKTGDLYRSNKMPTYRELTDVVRMREIQAARLAEVIALR